MKENKHSIQIGRESIGDVSGKELEILRRFIQDFLAKEKDINPFGTLCRRCYDTDRTTKQREKEGNLYRPLHPAGTNHQIGGKTTFYQQTNLDNG